MTAALDFPTLTIATGLVVLALALAMLHVGRTRQTYPGFGLWVVGSAAAAASMLMGWTRGGAPYVLSAVLSNTGAALALALVTMGLEDFLGRRRRVGLQVLLVGATLATSALFTWGVPWVRARILAGEALYALQVAWCLWLVVRGLPALLGSRNRLLEAALGLQALWSLLRVALLVAGDAVPQELLSNAAAQSVTFLVYPVVTAVMVYALTDLDLQRVQADLRASMDEVRTLRGIIPICSYCKKIRDDQGSWQQVEAYMSRHTDAAFSHGICPRCMSEHFPEEEPRG